VAKVADGEVDAQTHLSSHNDESDIPAQHCNDEKESTTSLYTIVSTVTIIEGG